jgi:hypothetical protein
MGKTKALQLPLKVLFVFTLIVSLLPIKTSFSSTGTIVSGVISTNTTWTKQGSPYRISGGIIVNPNITLTIEPGVEVIGKSGEYLDVQGKLKAIGTPDERIILRDAYINGWDWTNQSIHLEYTDLFHESFNGGFLVTSFRRDVILRHNRFSNGSIRITPQYYDVYVENNFFTNNSTLDISNGRSKVFVRNNTFKNEGISQADISISSRDLDGTLPNVEMNGNNFFGQNKLSVKLDGYNSIVFNGLDNYWGTTDPQLIDRRVYDSSNRLNIDRIAFKPFNNGYEFGILDAPTVFSVDDNDTTVRGLTDGDSKVHVYKGSELISQGMSAANGEFHVTIPLQTGGIQLNISVEDSYGRKSTASSVTVSDVTAPMTPLVYEVSNLSTSVIGKAEPGSTVFLKKGVDIIGSVMTTTDGNFDIIIEKQPAGSVLSIYSSDTVGNQSGTVTLTVKDLVAPLKPVLTTTDLTDQTTVINGTGEIGTIISIKANGMVLGSDIVDSNGLFSIEIPIQKAGSILETFAKDSAGNQSEVIVLAVRDVTPPVIKHIAQVTDQSSNINGLAEAGSIISVKSNGTEIGRAVTYNDGILYVQIVPQTKGTVLEISATDASGNISEIHRITVESSTNTFTFSDLNNNHRFYNEISYLLAREVITGFQDGSFRPSDKVTRAQAAIMIGRALDLDGTKRTTGFKDVGTSSAASGYIASAVERGIITGFKDNTYRPNDPVTRGQMAIFIARAYDLKNEAQVSFSDVPKGSASYVYIQRILAEGITTGYNDGTFKPERELIRSDFAAFMARALDEKFKVSGQ